MVCAICHESFLKPLSRRSTPAHASASSAASHAQRPAALGCGHTFHKSCIEDWFASSRMQRCPQCKVLHSGSPTVLFIDIDEEDYDDGRAAGSSCREDADVQQLAWDINRMHFGDESCDYRVMCELARRNQLLEDANMDLEEDLEETLCSLYSEMESREDKVDELTHELERQRRVQRRTSALLQESSECLQREREHTARLESRLEAVKAMATRLRENNLWMRKALEGKLRETRKHQAQHGYSLDLFDEL
ncbi:hypothetical protein IWW37_000410 [Coemansia sp. RSA 2050]|nr:hypothetical protein IWW37_000410 [Coemansia sp. RSA 2050]KAJ2734189.1 hypothetical protein IW152_002528 [Coemansia sp. BCRC 34962]